MHPIIETRFEFLITLTAFDDFFTHNSNAKLIKLLGSAGKPKIYNNHFFSFYKKLQNERKLIKIDQNSFKMILFIQKKDEFLLKWCFFKFHYLVEIMSIFWSFLKTLTLMIQNFQRDSSFFI